MSHGRGLLVRKRRSVQEPPSVDHYRVVSEFIAGGATQKDVLEDPATGDWYIAKLGRRKNDLEVMTEYIIHLVGKNLGAIVADAKIARFRGSLRFLSKYFLDRAKGEELVHGIQLFEQLYDQAEIDDVVGNKAREQGMFTLQAIRAAFGAHYIEYGRALEDDLFASLVDMIVHDAIIGVQDRHHANWGLIVQRGREAPPPRFSPLYDSARGLFCNESDGDLLRRFTGSVGQERLDGYAARSRPLMGWQGLSPAGGRKYLTHEQLVAAVYRDEPVCRGRITAMLARYDWRSLRDDLQRELGAMCGGHRSSLILTILKRRIYLINRAITGVVG
jgi:hypothetical protein